MKISRKQSCIALALLFILSTGFKIFGENDEDINKKHEEDTAAKEEQKIFGPRNGLNIRLTLDQCIKRALTYNPELEIADYSIQGAKEKKIEADHFGTPIFDYEYDLGPAPKDASDAFHSFFSGDLTVFNKMKVGVGVPIHTFGKVKTGKELAETGIVAERERKEIKKSEIVLQVKQLYYGILLAREVGHLLKSAYEGLGKEIQKREDQGGTDPSELLKLKLFRAELEKRKEEGDKREILAKEAMSVQLGIDEADRFDIMSDRLRPETPTMSNYDVYRQSALANRSDLKLLDLGYHAKEKQLQLESRLMSPNLAFGGFLELGRAKGITGLKNTDDFNNPFNYTRAGVGFQLKGQLDFHSSLSKVRQLRSELYKIDVQRQLAEDGVELEVKEAFLEVRNTKLDMERAEEGGKLSRQLLFLTQSNMDIGIAESKDLIDALSAFLQTRGQYFESVFNYNVAVAKLENKTGQMPE